MAGTSAIGIGAISQANVAVDILAKSKKRFLAHPDLAQAQLDVVLDQLSNIYKDVDNYIDIYTSIYFNPNNLDKLQENKARLRKIAIGEYTQLPKKSSYKCGLIDVIYKQNLDKFLMKIFRRKKYERLKDIFESLGKADMGFCDSLTNLCHRIQVDAKLTLDLVKKKDYKAANQKMDEAAEEYQPLRTAISEHLNKLRDLQKAIRKSS